MRSRAARSAQRNVPRARIGIARLPRIQNRITRHQRRIPIRPVPRRISRPIQRHRRRSQRNRQMQRPRIAPNNACRRPQQCHQRPKLRIPHHRFRRTTRRFHRRSQIIFARPVIHYAPHPKHIANLLAQRAKSFRRPTLRPPPASRTQHHIPLANSRTRKLLARPRHTFARNRQLHMPNAPPRPRTPRQLPVLIRDVNRLRLHALVVKYRHAKLPNRMRRKSNSPLDAAQKRQRRRLPQPLIINRRLPLRRTHSRNRRPHRSPIPRLHVSNLRSQPAALDQPSPSWMREPDNFGGGERITQRRNSRKCMDDVPQRSQSHYQESGLSHCGALRTVSINPRVE